VFNKKKWVALIYGNRWIAAKISHSRPYKLKIHRLAEFNNSQHLQDAQTQQTDKDALHYNLKKWLKAQRIPLRKLKIAISCPGVITRMITLPVLSEKDLEKLLTEQVDQYFTLNIAEYIVDYRILESIQEDGQQRLRVLLAAIPRARWEEYWNVWCNLGFAPKITDLAADCLARLYSRLELPTRKSANKPAESSRDIAIVDLSSERVEFILLEHGILFLYSDMEVMLEGLLDSVRDLDPVQRVIHSAQSDEQNGNAESSDSMAESDFDYEPESREQRLKREMEETLNPVFNTLVEFLNFFAARHFGKTVDCLHITGEYADLPYLGEIFERNLGILSKVGFPNDWQPKKKPKALNKTWMRYGSLYGLAIRED
jgi:type IV pilus assembly protein PilM